MDFEALKRSVIEDSFDELSSADLPNPFMPYKRKLLAKLPAALKAAYIAGLEDAAIIVDNSPYGAYTDDISHSIKTRIKELKGA